MDKIVDLSSQMDLRAKKKREAWELLESEMKSAKKKYPSWPNHAAAQAGIVVKQSGDIMAAALNVKYRRGNGLTNEKKQMRKAAIKTIVAAMRLLENL